LFVVLYCFECGVYGDFGFVVVDVVVDEVVYWNGLFYVGFYFVDGD